MTLLDDYLARTPRSRELFERATAIAAGRVDPDDRLHGALSALHRGRVRAAHHDVDGNTLPRLPRQLHLADPRPRPPGGRRRGGGAGPSRLRVRRPDRDRGRARRGDPATRPIDRAPALHQLGHRGDDVRHPGGAGVHRPAAHRQVRALLPRHARRGHGRHGGCAGGRCRGSSPSCRGATRMASKPTLRGREGDLAAIIIEPVQGAGGVRAPEPGFLDWSCAAFTERVGRAADLRRDHLVPGRARRCAGALRRTARPDDPGQDHRWRLPARGVRRSRGRDGHLRRAAAGRGEPRRDVQRQPGGCGSGAGDAAPADARHVRAGSTRSARGSVRRSRQASSARASMPGSRSSARSSRSSAVRV